MQRLSTLFLSLSLLCLASLANASLAPADFAKNEAYLDAKISPDGKKLAVRVLSEGKRRLIVLDAKSLKTKGNIFFPGQQEVGDFFWANDKRLVIKLMDSEPWLEEPFYVGELFSVNYDGSKPELIYGYRVEQDNKSTRLRQKEATRGWAGIVNSLPEDEKHILISSTRFSEDGKALPTIHKLNIYNGRMSKPITRSPVPGALFRTDQENQLRLVMGTNVDGDKELYTYADEKWTQITDVKLDDVFTPLRFDNSGKNIYVYSRADKDKAGLYKLNLETHKLKHIYTDENVDITSWAYSSDNSKVFAMRTDEGYPTYLMFGKKDEEAKLFKSLLASFPGQEVSITSSDEDGELYIIYVSSDTMAGSYYLYDNEKRRLMALFSNLDHLKPASLATTEPVSFEATDGTMVPGYITYPKDAKGKVPLVVLVHGGPHGVRDYWLFDRETQMLASQGYAVLKVNFRGSFGFGKSFLEAGYKHWGDLIQQDIIDGTNWAIAQGRIDQDRVCIMGGSFGGYSAVQASILEPELYSCAVATAGIYDLKMLYEEGDIKDWYDGDNFLEKVVGLDESSLKAFSPVANVEKLKVPLFIAHGGKDDRAPIEHAEALREQLEKYGKAYKWFVKSGEGHGFFNEANRAEYYEEVAGFLANHLK